MLGFNNFTITDSEAQQFKPSIDSLLKMRGSVYLIPFLSGSEVDKNSLYYGYHMMKYSFLHKRQA